MPTPEQYLSDLRDIVRLLKPTGERGFEGLMSAVLSPLTGRSFALAASGAQHGRDGQSALDGGAILFEGKLYGENLPADQIYSKISQVSIRSGASADLWIVGASAPVSVQIRDNAMLMGEERGLAVIVADWQATSLPVLATLLALEPVVASQFLSRETGRSEAEIAACLDAVRQHPQFAARAAELRNALDQPSIAPAYAQKNNRAWLQRNFTSADRAQAVFGQRLAPGDSSGAAGIVDRSALRGKLAGSMFAPPNGSVTAIVGADGNGKSWIFAQAWMNEPEPPLTVVVIPDDIQLPFTSEAFERLLIAKLIQQTDDAVTAVVETRWRKYIERWRQAADVPRPRLVMVLDGINQRPSVPWLRAIEVCRGYLSSIGGRLVFSCREFFYRDYLQRLRNVIRVEVPEWSTEELEVLLKQWGTSLDKLTPHVISALRNPRVFSVAAQLRQSAEIETFDELSVSRLLFEHIRAGASPETSAMSVDEFVRNVRDHADHIIERLRADERRDLTVFDRLETAGSATGSLTDQLSATSEGRFYARLTEDSTKYTLKEDGLWLALGLALVDAAWQAHRNGSSIEDALSKLLDPIAALDKTAEVLIAAIIVAVLDEDTPDVIVVPLVRSFVGLQNLGFDRYGEFKALLRRRPKAFLLALEEAALAEKVYSNLSWLIDGFLESRNESDCAAEMVSSIHRWLSVYSLAPERMVFHAEQGAERTKRLEDRKRELQEAVDTLNASERSLLGLLIHEDRGDYTELNKLAFQFLAGRPLADYAESLRNWAFADALNGGYSAARDDFFHLIQFNRNDWSAARARLLEAVEPLRGVDVSTDGQWALIHILRATGHSPDAEHADAIADELTKDRERWAGWRRIEDYCASDPCDPTSERPDNIDKTAKDYAALDVTKLRTHLGMSHEDHFFEDARAGLARFEPEAAATVMRRLADDALTRPSNSLRLAVFMLDDHTAALEDDGAQKFAEKAGRVAAEANAVGDKHHELWVAAQHSLEVAFPHMTGNEQFEALLNHPPDDNIALQLLALARACDPKKYEAGLRRAVVANDTVLQSRVLAIGQHTDTVLTESSRSMVGDLIGSASRLVRLSALALICRLNDKTLLDRVVQSGWSAAACDPTEEKVEMHYGSRALVLAAKSGLLSVEACLERISLGGYVSLVEELGADAARQVAARLDVAMRKAAGHPAEPSSVDIEQRFGLKAWLPMIFDVSEKVPDNLPVREQFARVTESEDIWHERQRRSQEAATAFEQSLTTNGAELAVQAVTAELMAAIGDVLPALLRSWCAHLLTLDRGALNRLHNFSLLVAQAMSGIDPAASVLLFRKLESSEPFIRMTFGVAGIPLDAVAVWSGADNDALNSLRFARIDAAQNDHAIAMEVLAAIRAGKDALVRAYVLDRCEQAEPSLVARAITVAGYSMESDWALGVLARYKDAHGFLKHAYRNATYAMDRHRWSRHWAQSMASASAALDLWRFGVLLAKIVDGRLSAEEVGNSGLVERYGPSFNSLIRRRVESWEKKRKDKLFGMDAPDARYLAG